MDKQLECCPFCYNNRVAMLKHNKNHGWYVVCEVCGGRTGCHPTVEVAKESWGIWQYTEEPFLER